jgi:hypothetical protein
MVMPTQMNTQELVMVDGPETKRMMGMQMKAMGAFQAAEQS